MTEPIEQNPASLPEQKNERLSRRLKRWISSPSFKCLMMDIVASIMILVIFFFVCVPKKYDLTVNSIAPETIKATKDVTDEVTTQIRRDEAAAAVKISYKDISDELISRLDSVFEELRTARLAVLAAEPVQTENGEAAETPAANPEAAAPEEIPQPRELTDEEIQAAAGMTTVEWTEEQLRFIMQLPPQDFENMTVQVKKAVESVLKGNAYREDQADQILEAFQNAVTDPNLAAYQMIIPKITEICVKPNMVVDREATEEARQKAMEAVDPIIYLQGRTIIREGDPVYEYQLSMLRSLGLLNNERNFDYSVYVGSVIVVLVAMACFFMSLKLLSARVLSDIRKTAVILIVLILSVGMAALAHLLPSQFVIPLAMGAMLGTVLIDYRSGISLTITLSILFAAMTSGNANSTFFDVVILMCMTIAESILSIWFLKGRPQRVRVLIAGVLSAIIGFVILIGIQVLTASGAEKMLSIGAWSCAGGILSGVLAIAFQPVLEQIFRLATPSRLLELTNPNQPLMKRLMIEAPGTYHHSIIVANLAEAAADKIGANPYLARAGAYYHDIGKLKRPGYFKENQNGDNPHERTDPYVSAAILVSHTMDGVLMAQKEHMPKEVQDIILQHHGVTPVMYFYHKALQMSDGSHVDIDEFRYAGPKPQTKEAAVVMLADTIEAAVRSMKEPTPKGIDQFIERLVRGKLEDGQLSESPLSLSDIDQICIAFSGILKGVYHERIEYPNVPHYAGKTVPGEERDRKNASSPSDISAAPQDNAENAGKPGEEPKDSAENEKEETNNDA